MGEQMPYFAPTYKARIKKWGGFKLHSLRQNLWNTLTKLKFAAMSGLCG